jgi:hypothetical protein
MKRVAGRTVCKVHVVTVLDTSSPGWLRNVAHMMLHTGRVNGTGRVMAAAKQHHASLHLNNLCPGKGLGF